MVDVHYDIDANSILDMSALGVLTNEGITYRKTEFGHKMHMTEESRQKAVQQGQE